MAYEGFDWKGYLAYAGYPEDEIPENVTDEELAQIRDHWARTVYQEELAIAAQDPFLETKKEREEAARDKLLALAPEYRQAFGLKEAQPAEAAFSADEFREHVLNNPVQDAPLDYYLKTFAAKRIGKNTKYEYPYLEGLTKKDFQDLFMERNGIDPDLTTVEHIRNGEFGPAWMAQRAEEESNLPKGSAMRQGWLTFKKLTGLTTETFGDALGIEWMRNIGKGITENAIKTIEEEGYRSKYGESLVDTFKAQGPFAAAGKVLEMAQENWATTGVPLALAGMSALFGIAARNPRLAAQGLAGARASLAAATSADVAMGTGAAATVGRVGASTIAKSLAFASALASGLEVGATREELEEQSKKTGKQLYDPSDPGDVVAWGLLSAALDHVGNMMTFVGGGGLVRAAKGLVQSQQTRMIGAAEAAIRQAGREAGKSWGRKVVEAMGTEGITEALQEYANIMPARNKGVEYTPKEIRDRMIDAGAVGAFMGGGMRGVQALTERKPRTQSESDTTTPQQPTQTQTPPPNVPSAPNQPPPPGFNVASNTNYAEIEGGWAAWDGYNTGYGNTKEEASQAIIDQSNKNKDTIDPANVTPTANESRVSFGNGGEIVVTGNGHKKVIGDIISLHNANDNVVNLDGTKTHNFDATTLSGLSAEALRNRIEHSGKTAIPDTRSVRKARADQVDIAINYDGEKRDSNGNVIGRRAELVLDDATRNQLAAKGYRILGSQFNNDVQTVQLYRDGQIYHIRLETNGSEVTSKVRTKKIIGHFTNLDAQVERELSEQKHRVIDVGGALKEVQNFVSVSSAVRTGGTQIERTIGGLDAKFVNRKALENLIKKKGGKVIKNTDRSITYELSGETLRLDLQTNGDVVVSRDGRFLGAYQFDGSDLGNGMERATYDLANDVTSVTRFSAQDVYNDLGYRRASNRRQNVLFIKDNENGDYYVIKVSNNGDVRTVMVPYDPNGFFARLEALESMRTIEDVRQVYQDQFRSGYVEFVDFGGGNLDMRSRTTSLMTDDINDVQMLTSDEVDDIINNPTNPNYNPRLMENLVKVIGISQYTSSTSTTPARIVDWVTVDDVAGVRAFIERAKGYGAIIADYDSTGNNISVKGKAWNAPGSFNADAAGLGLTDLYEEDYLNFDPDVHIDNLVAQGTATAIAEIEEDIKKVAEATRKAFKDIRDLLSRSSTYLPSVTNADVGIIESAYRSTFNHRPRDLTTTAQKAKDIRRHFYRARLLQARLHIDVLMANPEFYANRAIEAELRRLQAYDPNWSNDEVRFAAAETEEIALRLEEEFLNLREMQVSTSISRQIWDAIYPGNSGVEYGSFIERIHNQGNDFRFSRDVNAPRAERHMSLLDELRNHPFIGNGALSDLIDSGKLVLLETQQEIEDALLRERGYKPMFSELGNIQGFASNDNMRVYLSSWGIKQGDAFRVLLHEMGAHTRRFGFSEAEFQEILAGIKANSTAQTPEGRHIRHAMWRAQNAKVSPNDPHYWEEVAAYLVEDSNEYAGLGMLDTMQAWVKRWLFTNGYIDATNFHYQDFTIFSLGMLRDSRIPLRLLNGKFDYSRHQNRIYDTRKFVESYVTEDIAKQLGYSREEVIEMVAAHLAGTYKAGNHVIGDLPDEDELMSHFPTIDADWRAFDRDDSASDLRFSRDMETAIAEARDEVLRPHLPPVGVQKDASVIYPNVADEIANIRFSRSIGKKTKDKYKKLLIKRRPDLDPEIVLAKLEKYNDFEMQDAVLHWTITGAIAFDTDEDSYTVREAVRISKEKNIDYLNYDNPNVLINDFLESRPQGPPLVPEDFSEFFPGIFTKEKKHGDAIVSYEIKDDKEGQTAMREIMNTHWGENVNPWCILRADDKGRVTENSFDWWREYSGLPKRVAFKNGNLISFMATRRKVPRNIENVIEMLIANIENDVAGYKIDVPEDVKSHDDYIKWLDNEAFKISYIDDDTAVITHSDGTRVNYPPYFNMEFNIEFKRQADGTYMSSPEHVEEWWDEKNKSHPDLEWAKLDPEVGRIRFSIAGEIDEQDINTFSDSQIEDVISGDIRYSRVTDKNQIAEYEAELAKGRVSKPLYRAMVQWEDGSLHSPMAEIIAGKTVSLYEGDWEKADEFPELVIKTGKDKGKFPLKKVGGGTVPAAYAPFLHSSLFPLNDQFYIAYKRPLVIVQMAVPASELNVPESELTEETLELSEKRPGKTTWNAGTVAAKLGGREVMLSRYGKIEKILSDEEVAGIIADRIREVDENISIPINVVHKGLLRELVRKGVKIRDVAGKIKSEDHAMLTDVLADIQENGVNATYFSNESNLRFSIAGEIGAARLDALEEVTTRMDNLVVARDMEQAGKDAKAIKFATGWERGVDNKWKYEIDDDYDTLKNIFKKLYGFEYSYFKRLNNELSEINNEISILENHSLVMNPNNQRAIESRDEFILKRDRINSKISELKDKLKKDFLLSDVLKNDNKILEAYPILKEYSFSFDNNMNSITRGSTNLEDKKVKINLSLILDEVYHRNSNYQVILHEIQHIIQNEEGFAQGANTSLTTEYRRLAGEVEARNVARRAFMSSEERRNTLLSETEDVARADQIIIYDALEALILPFLRFSIAQQPTTPEQGTAISNAPGMYKMRNGTIQAHPEYIPPGLETETAIYAAVAISDIAKNEPGLEDVRAMINADEVLREEVLAELSQRGIEDTRDNEFLYAIRNVLQTREPEDPTYQAIVDVFHDAITKATGGIQDDILLTDSDIAAAAHAITNTPFEPLIGEPVPTVPTPKPTVFDQMEANWAMMQSTIDEAVANTEISERETPIIRYSIAGVDMRLDGVEGYNGVDGRQKLYAELEQIYGSTHQWNEWDSFYNQLAAAQITGTREVHDVGALAAPADSNRGLVDQFLNAALPDYLKDKIQIEWTMTPDAVKNLNGGLASFDPRGGAADKLIYIQGWGRTVGQVIRSAAWELSRFGWNAAPGAMTNLKKPLVELYNLHESAIYQELSPYYTKYKINRANVSDKHKIFLVQTYFAKMNQDILTGNPNALAQRIGIDPATYKRIHDEIVQNINTATTDLTNYIENYAAISTDPEIAKAFTQDILRLIMDGMHGRGAAFVYETANSAGPSDTIYCYTNDFGLHRKFVAPTDEDNRYARIANEIKQNLKWWRETFEPWGLGELAENFCRFFLRNFPMHNGLSFLHLNVPSAHLGDTTITKATSLISRIWQRVDDPHGIEIREKLKVMERIHAILRDHNYDARWTENATNGYEALFRSLGITDEKSIATAQLADRALPDLQAMIQRNAAEIRADFAMTIDSLVTHMSTSRSIPEREIANMIQRMNNYAESFLGDYEHRTYEAYSLDGLDELIAMKHDLNIDPNTGELTIHAKATAAQKFISDTEQRLGGRSAEFYKQTEEARNIVRRASRLDSLRKYKQAKITNSHRGLTGGELDERVIKEMNDELGKLIDDVREMRTADRGIYKKFNYIPGAKRRKLDERIEADREYMNFLGRVTDPLMNAIYSIDQQKKILEKLHFNRELGEHIISSGMGEIRGDAVSSSVGEGTIKDISTLEGGTFLEYIRVYPEFQKEINAEYRINSKVRDSVLGGVIDVWKANNTIYSLRLGINNYVGNFSMLLASGHLWRFANIFQAGQITKRQFLERFTTNVNGLDTTTQELYEEMRSARVVGGTMSEMNVMAYGRGVHEKVIGFFLKHLRDADVLSSQGKFVAETWVNSFLEKMKTFYAFGDEWVKPLMYLNNRANAIAKWESKLNPNAPEFEGDVTEWRKEVRRRAIEEAAEQTVRESVSWENSPQFIRWLSQKNLRIFTPDFLMHNFQMLRITASNFLRLGECFRELNSLEVNNERDANYKDALVKEIAQRGVGGAMTTAVYAGLMGATGSVMALVPYMVNVLFNNIEGEGDDDDKKGMFFGPDEWEGAQRLINYKTGGNNLFVPVFKSGDKIYAWNYVRSSVMLTHAPVRPPTDDPTFTDYGAVIMRNIVDLSNGTMTQQLINNMMGKDRFGREIGIVEGWGRVLERTLVPGFARQLVGVTLGYPLSDNMFHEGRVIKIPDLLGITVNAYDPRDVANHLAYDINSHNTDRNIHRRNFVEQLSKSDRLSDRQIVGMIADMRERNARDLSKANYVVTGLKQVGMTDQEIVHWLTHNRKTGGDALARKHAVGLLKGKDIYDEALITTLVNKRKQLNEGPQNLRMSKDELAVVNANLDKAIRMYKQALRVQ